MNLNKQDVFNKVWQHFVVDKNPGGFNPATCSCLYVADSGAKCAIGIFFDDDRLKDVHASIGSIHDFMIDTRGMSAELLNHAALRNDPGYHNMMTLARALVDRFGPMTEKDIKFLLQLQDAHDASVRGGKGLASFHGMIQNHLVDLAKKYFLSIPQ